MTELGLKCFGKFIKYGYNHLNIDGQSVRECGLNLKTNLDKINSGLNVHSVNDRTLNLIIKDLSELAVSLQGFAINSLKIYPKNGTLINVKSEPQGQLFNDLRKPRLHWNWYIPDIDFSISFLKNLEKKWMVKLAGFEKISIKINGNKVHLPNTLNKKFIDTLLSTLQQYKDDKRMFRVKQKKEYKAFFFKMVYVTLQQYLEAHFASGVSENTVAKVSAVVLMVAGYIESEEEYEHAKKVKDYRKYLDKDHLKTHDQKKYVRKPRYYTYQEILNQKSNQIKKKDVMTLDSFHYCYR